MQNVYDRSLKTIRSFGIVRFHPKRLLIVLEKNIMMIFLNVGMCIAVSVGFLLTKTLLKTVIVQKTKLYGCVLIVIRN